MTVYRRLGFVSLLSVAGVTAPAWLYDGEANETVRFMEALPVEAPEVILSEETELWLQQVEEEQRLVEELPFPMDGTIPPPVGRSIEGDHWSARSTSSS